MILRLVRLPQISDVVNDYSVNINDEQKISTTYMVLYLVG